VALGLDGNDTVLANAGVRQVFQAGFAAFRKRLGMAEIKTQMDTGRDLVDILSPRAAGRKIVEAQFPCGN
jgi:hypothetical protein